jgi:hypothetical protein
MLIGRNVRDLSAAPASLSGAQSLDCDQAVSGGTSA